MCMISHSNINMKLFLLAFSANHCNLRGKEKKQVKCTHHFCWEVKKTKQNKKPLTGGKVREITTDKSNSPAWWSWDTSFNHCLTCNRLLTPPSSLITMFSIFSSFFSNHIMEYCIIRTFSHDAVNMFKGHIRIGSYCCGVATDTLLSLIQLGQEKKYLIHSKEKKKVNYTDC